MRLESFSINDQFEWTKGDSVGDQNKNTAEQHPISASRKQYLIKPVKDYSIN